MSESIKIYLNYYGKFIYDGDFSGLLNTRIDPNSCGLSMDINDGDETYELNVYRNGKFSLEHVPLNEKLEDILGDAVDFLCTKKNTCKLDHVAVYCNFDSKIFNGDYKTVSSIAVQKKMQLEYCKCGEECGVGVIFPDFMCNFRPDGIITFIFNDDHSLKKIMDNLMQSIKQVNKFLTS